MPIGPSAAAKIWMQIIVTVSAIQSQVAGWLVAVDMQALIAFYAALGRIERRRPSSPGDCIKDTHMTWRWPRMKQMKHHDDSAIMHP